jgi:hypothetical protein
MDVPMMYYYLLLFRLDLGFFFPSFCLETRGKIENSFVNSRILDCGTQNEFQ